MSFKSIINSEIGNNVIIHHPDLVNIYDSKIGRGTKIGSFVEIGRCKIGSGCIISSFCFLCENVVIEDDVFLGPHCCTTNVMRPRAFINQKDNFKETIIKKGATIGAGVTIIPGITIGEFAFIGAGSVVTKHIPAHSLAYGNPANIVGQVNRNGISINERHYEKRRD